MGSVANQWTGEQVRVPPEAISDNGVMINTIRGWLTLTWGWVGRNVRGLEQSLISYSRSWNAWEEMLMQLIK